MELLREIMIVVWWTCGLIVGFLLGYIFQKQTKVVSSCSATKQTNDGVDTKENSSSGICTSSVFVDEKQRWSSDSVGTQTTEEEGEDELLFKLGGSRYLELLVHNVSHTDLVLGMAYQSTSSTSTTSSTTSSSEEELLGRPRFSAFDSYCQRIKQALNTTTTTTSTIRTFPRVKRSHHTPHYTFSTTPRTSHSSSSTKEPVGFHLGTAKEPIIVQDEYDFHNLRIRGSDVSKLQPHHIQNLLSTSIHSPRQTTTTTTTCTQTESNSKKEDQSLLHLNAVYFPLLSCLMRRWNTQIANKFPQQFNDDMVQRVIILVTGVGTPRNYTHDLYGNSTKRCAELMETYIQTLYPNVQVVR